MGNVRQVDNASFFNHGFYCLVGVLWPDIDQQACRAVPDTDNPLFSMDDKEYQYLAWW
jgi:hypothetical protein